MKMIFSKTENVIRRRTNDGIINELTQESNRKMARASMEI